VSSSETKITKVNIQPGINKNTTELDSEGTFVSCDKIRFFYGKAEKIGGWQNESYTGSVNGVCRSLHTWTDLEEQDYLGIGTHKQLGLLTAGTYYDITPVNVCVCAVDILNASAGSNIVTVSIAPAGGTQAGDYFFFDTVSACIGNGLDLFQSSVYEILSAESTYFTYEASTTATETSTAAGGITIVKFLVPNGLADNGVQYGWGAGTWGTPGQDTVGTCVELTDAFSMTDGSNLVSVNDTAHGRSLGDTVYVSTQTNSIGGMDLTGGYYNIVSIGDADNYTLSTGLTNSTSTATSGGTIVLNYSIDGWGDPRSSATGGVSVNLRVWDLDNWGEDLLATPNGGALYQWDATNGTGTRAVLVTAAPSIINSMIVAQNGRHVVLGGTKGLDDTYDPMLVRWSDSEDLADWGVSAGNQAGFFRLENGSYIIGMQETRGETMVFTDESVYSMRRVGGTAVFTFVDLGRHNGLISKNASVDINGRVFWMGYNSFQIWEGNLHTLPCTVQEFVFDPNSSGSVNQAQKEKVFAVTNREFNEIWWFYPSKNSTEVDRYVVYNYLEKLWYIGTLERTAWHDVDIFDRPYALDSSGQIYIQEQGSDDVTGNLKAQLVTSYFDIEDGQDMMFVDRYIPDHTFNKEMAVCFHYKKYPQATEKHTKGPYTFSPSKRKLHPRVRGRQMQICYSTSIQGGTMRLGSDRIGIKPDGGR
jgi:hypothetical protein